MTTDAILKEQSRRIDRVEKDLYLFKEQRLDTCPVLKDLASKKAQRQILIGTLINMGMLLIALFAVLRG